MPSFDVVSEIDFQEVRNAVDQAQKEIAQRYDFRGSKSSLELEGEDKIILVGDDKMKLQSLQDILRQRLAKRNISLKSVEFKDPQDASSNTLRQEVLLKNGLTQDGMKKINKIIKDSKQKVNTQIQGDQLRVMGKKRDDLQAVIQLLKTEVKDIELQYTNFRD